MAHGPVVGFKGDGEMEENLVPPGRPEAPGLDYLAMGDWHGVKRIGPKLWYSGTPEGDRFKPIDGGTISGGGSVLEAAVAEILTEVLGASEKEAKERYVAPVKRRVMVGLKRLMPRKAALATPGRVLARCRERDELLQRLLTRTAQSNSR
jgi:hypothetical protein